jgi:hypothetical protein
MQKKSTTKKRRKKGSRYKTGIHISPKSPEPICYRSGWELIVAQILDMDSSVEQYFYEAIKIPYLSNIKTHKVRTYYPDFLVVYKDGTAKLVEVKQKRMMNNKLVLKKAEAGRQWAENQKKRQTTYEIWEDSTIKAFKMILENTNKTQIIS